MIDIREETIRAAFGGPGIPAAAAGDGPDWIGANGRGGGSGALTAAAVLVPIVRRDGAPTVLFTRRTDHLKSHSGQISFPGGRMEERDPTPEATALRETREEIGLAESEVELLGRLDISETGTGYRVIPVVGMVDPPLSLVPDANEVAEIFEAPLDFLVDPANHRFETRTRDNVERRFHAIPYGGYFIWGLTARILVNLSEVLARR